MPATVRVELNISGINEVMKSAGVEGVLVQAGERIRAGAGEGFVVRAVPHRWVARVFVVADTYAAKRAEATGRVLTRAI